MENCTYPYSPAALGCILYALALISWASLTQVRRWSCADESTQAFSNPRRALEEYRLSLKSQLTEELSRDRTKQGNVPYKLVNWRWGFRQWSECDPRTKCFRSINALVAIYSKATLSLRLEQWCVRPISPWSPRVWDIAGKQYPRFAFDERGILLDPWRRYALPWWPAGILAWKEVGRRLDLIQGWLERDFWKFSVYLSSDTTDESGRGESSESHWRLWGMRPFVLNIRHESAAFEVVR